MKNLFKTASMSENFAGFLFLEGGPDHSESNEDPKDKNPEKKEKQKNAEAAKITPKGKAATEENNEAVKTILESKEEMKIAELLNETQINKIKQDLESILTDPEKFEKIKNGDIAITVFGSASDETFNELNYTVNGVELSVTNNWELAKLRAFQSEEIVRNSLAEKRIYNPIIIKNIPVGETNQDGVGKSNKRISGIKLVEMNNSESIVNNYDNVIIDRSGSMKDDAELVAVAEKNGKGQSLILKKRHGDTLEKHLDSIEKYVKNSPKGSKVLIITDEKDDWSNGEYKTSQEKNIAYINKVNQLAKIARDKNIKVIMRFANPNGSGEVLNFNYFSIGQSMVRGKNDQDTFNQIKRLNDFKKTEQGYKMAKARRDKKLEEEFKKVS